MSALATLLLGHFRVGALITWLGRSYKLLKTMLSALATLVRTYVRTSVANAVSKRITNLKQNFKQVISAPTPE